MSAGIRLITSATCDYLLGYSRIRDLRERYNQASFGGEGIDFLRQNSPYQIADDLELDVQDDCHSSIKIFDALRSITRVQANDRRLWVTLTHTRFFHYTKARWKINEETSHRTILDRFHFEGSGLATRMRNSISRLWWAAKLTYTEEYEDPHELTRLLWSKQDLYTGIVERSYGTYENVVTAILETFRQNPELSEDELRSLYTGLNAIGGVKVLPLLSRADILMEIERIAKFKNIQLQT